MRLRSIRNGMVAAARSGRIMEWHAIREDFEAEYRARYGLNTNR